MNDHYRAALNQAIHWIEEQLHPVAIIASGSIIRGNPNANSDFDIFVIHEAPFRQKIHRFFNGIPCEIFLNNIAQVYRYLEEEVKRCRPSTAHMLTTGTLIKGGDNPAIQQLLLDVKAYVHKAPVLTEQQLTLHRYTIVTLYEDATDLLDTNEVTTLYFLNKAVAECIDYFFLRNQTVLPRAKERIQHIEAQAPELGQLITSYYLQQDTREKHAIAGLLVKELTAHTGFFEWETLPE